MKGIIFPSLLLALLCMPFNGKAQGYVDKADVAVISGWACDADGNSRWVHVYDGDVHIVSTTSNTTERPDAAGFCRGNSWVGFSVETPRLTPGGHVIGVYVNDSPTPGTVQKLAGSSALHVPSAEFTGTSPFGVIESASSEWVTGWVCDIDGTDEIPLEISIQYDLRGPLRRLTQGSATQIRSGGGICGTTAMRSFALALPAVRGGVHGIVVNAKNRGAGSDRYLEEFSPYTRRVSFPYGPSLNSDPDVMHAADCWYQNPTSVKLDGCLGAMPPWIYSISKTVFTDRAPAPQAGYAGPPARLRNDGLTAGTVLKIHTYDATTDMYPWDYNFQALSTNMQEVFLDAGSRPELSISMRIRPDWNWTDPAEGPPPGIETGNKPWLNLIVATVFRDRVTGAVYFVEMLPYVRGKYPAIDSQSTVGGPSEARNARIRLRDLEGATSLPSQMLVGESRSFSVDLYSSFQKAFAHEVNKPAWSDLVFTGAYIGTEQYGKHGFALDVARISVSMPP